MRHILYTMFLEDCILNLEEKYQHILKEHNSSYYFYANLIEIPLYYKLFTWKKNPDYKIYDKLHTKKHFDVVELIKTNILENNYDTDMLLFLYGYVTHVILDKHLEEYINTIFSINNKKNNMKNYSKISKSIEAQFYKKRNKKKINKYKIPTASLILNDQSISLIDQILSQIFYSHMGINVYKISFKKFVKYQTHWRKDIFGFKKFILGFMDKFSRKKKYSAASISNHRSYKCKTNYLFINETINFEDIYKEALKESMEILNILNDEIFYHKVKKNRLIEAINKIL